MRFQFLALACTVWRGIQAYSFRDGRTIGKATKLGRQTFRNRDLVNVCIRLPRNAHICFHRWSVLLTHVLLASRLPCRVYTYSRVKCVPEHVSV